MLRAHKPGVPPAAETEMLMGRAAMLAKARYGACVCAIVCVVGAAGTSAGPASAAGVDAAAGAPAIRVGGSSRYATIAQGIAAAEAAGSHRVNVEPGTYTETDRLGPADNGLTIAARPGTATVVGSFSVAGASSITLSGLAFQGDGSSVAISLLNSTQVRVVEASFTEIGQAVLFDATSLSTVTRSTITNATNSAIEAKDGSANDSITYTVLNGDMAAGTLGAIWLHGTSASIIEHNVIMNTAGAGISLTDFDPPGSTDTQNDNATIAFNGLIGTDAMSEDSGAIYVLGRSQISTTGIAITMNLVMGVGSSSATHAVGIYLDDNASGVTVSRNVVQATPTMSDVFEIHGGSNNKISGNIFDLGTGDTDDGLFQQDEADQMPQGSFQQLQNNVVSGNIYATESNAPHDPGFADLTGMIGNTLVTRNDYWAFTGAPLNVQGTGAQGDTAPSYDPPASQPAQSVSDYASWSGAGIRFKAIDASRIAQPQ